MLFNGRTLIFTFSRTQVRIAEHERLQSLFKTSMSGMNDVHATRQVCRPAEKMAGKKIARHKFFWLIFMQTRGMYLHFTCSNVWANGNN